VQNTYPFLFWLNSIALPYTVFSVVYQWRVAKQWCVLCLAVQAILLLLFVNNILTLHWTGFPVVSILQPDLILFAACFAVPIISWLLIKPLLLKTQDAKRQKRQLLRLKYDSHIFEALLARQKQITEEPFGLGITIGNPNASNIIIKVCNPYCGPCAKAHPDIEKLVQENSNIKAQIIFTATAAETDRRSKPVKHLMAIAAKEDTALTHKALDDWYLAEKKDYEAFAAKYPMNGELKLQDEKLKAMDSWCQEEAIAFTPTFFINGKQLPNMYNIKDLTYFLPV